jgi:hypothetical protein
MRELTQEEIDQVSAGPTLPGPISAIPTITNAAPSNFPASIHSDFGNPFLPLPASQRIGS